MVIKYIFATHAYNSSKYWFNSFQADSRLIENPSAMSFQFMCFVLCGQCVFYFLEPLNSILVKVTKPNYIYLVLHYLIYSTHTVSPLDGTI